MRIALLTERVRRNDERPGLLPQPEDILADCTQGGARAVNQEKLLGTLEVGKKADLLVIDTLRPYLVPAGRIVSAVVHSGHPADIESVMIDGQFVVRKGKVLTMDEDAIIKEADAVGRRSLGQGARSRPAECAAPAAPALINLRPGGKLVLSRFGGNKPAVRVVVDELVLPWVGIVILAVS